MKETPATSVSGAVLGSDGIVNISKMVPGINFKQAARLTVLNIFPGDSLPQTLLVRSSGVPFIVSDYILCPILLCEQPWVDTYLFFKAVDSDGTWTAITIYNMETGRINMEDVIIIPEPCFRTISIKAEGWGLLVPN